eukprot:719496-Prymnesium_polylepis.1
MGAGSPVVGEWAVHRSWSRKWCHCIILWCQKPQGKLKLTKGRAVTCAHVFALCVTSGLLSRVLLSAKKALPRCLADLVDPDDLISTYAVRFGRIATEQGLDLLGRGAQPQQETSGLPSIQQLIRLRHDRPLRHSHLHLNLSWGWEVRIELGGAQ